MKKSIKQTRKTTTSSAQKNTRPHTAMKGGYKETVYNEEEQHDYQKSDMAKNNKKNTSGPKQ